MLARQSARGAFKEYVHFQTRLAKELNKARQYEKANDRLSQAIRIGEQHLDRQRDTFLANAYHNKGFVNYFYFDNFDAAIENYTAALEIRNRRLSGAPPYLFNGLLAIGDSYLFKEEYQEAIEALKKIINNPGYARFCAGKCCNFVAK